MKKLDEKIRKSFQREDATAEYLANHPAVTGDGPVFEVNELYWKITRYGSLSTKFSCHRCTQHSPTQFGGGSGNEAVNFKTLGDILREKEKFVKAHPHSQIVVCVHVNLGES